MDDMRDMEYITYLVSSVVACLEYILGFNLHPTAEPVLAHRPATQEVHG